MRNEEICIRYQNGDSDVCEELYKNNKSWLRSIATFYANHYPKIMYDAEDYMQEGFLAVLRAAEHFNPDKGASFKTYAWAAVKNAIYTIIRKEYNNLFGVELPEDENEQQTDQENEDDEVITEPDLYRLNPEQVLIQKEWTNNIHDSIWQLTPRENTWIRFRYGFGNDPHSLAESARTFYLSENRGNDLEKSALKHLKKTLLSHQNECL